MKEMGGGMKEARRFLLFMRERQGCLERCHDIHDGTMSHA